jgi:DNA modification methylase
MLKNMDCLDFMSELPEGSVDLVLTDPPYGISKKTGFQYGGGEQFNRIKISKDFGKWDHCPTTTLRRAIEEFYRILRVGGTVIIFYDMWKMQELKDWVEYAGFRMIRKLEWIKSNPVPLNQYKTYLGNACEMAIVGTKGAKPTFHGKYDNGLYHCPVRNGGERIHPTQKPLSLIEDIIRKHSNSGDVVMDCFLGSGTTALAAGILGRTPVGCEKDLNYYKAMIRRLREYGIKN